MNPVIPPTAAIPMIPVKRLFGRLLDAVLSPLNEASAVVRHEGGAEPARRLDHPTYLRRGLCIAGLTEPVVRGQ
ncbi:MAG TPA: hypothetical protein PKA20_13125 [Burkholderiaceae bacterium]|nr:hypothetical protein [Burkholderiaceae bacterium]